MDISQSIYVYKATLVRVIDGDTIVCDLDLGFQIRKIWTVRFRDVDTFERTGAQVHPLGNPARDFLGGLFKRYGLDFYLRTARDHMGVYNRLEGWVFLEAAPGQWLDVSATMRGSGYDKLLAGPVVEKLSIIPAGDISLVFPI